MITFSVVLVYCIRKWKNRSGIMPNEVAGEDDLACFDASRTSKQTNLKSSEDNTGDIKFTPLLSIQRYEAVKDVFLGCTEIKRVADLGCGEGNFIKYLKNVRHIAEISVVDQDPSCCDTCSYRSKPLPYEWLSGRASPLIIKVYQGNILEHDYRLQNYDAVSSIEVIEHLLPSQVQQFSKNIFEYIKPRLVIVTTPNADFNVLFNSPKKFRHWDHKFEWTRQQFQQWCEVVLTKYPSYEYTIKQIGYGPKGTEHVGGCSQMAVFVRKVAESVDKNFCESYQLLSEENYPVEHAKLPNQNISDERYSSDSDDQGFDDDSDRVYYEDFDEEESWE